MTDRIAPPRRDPATEAQVRAASPASSTWLAANAGSGKTRVLTDRVARLLLDDVLPEHILCLTYTKAAASEMQNRLFRRLGGWAMLDDDALRQNLQVLGVDRPLDPEALRKARTLFARAIEAPGGLRIQTIHAFCAQLLRRFPLEARVSPQFTEMEDRAAALLRAEILERMAEETPALVDAIAPHLTDDGIAPLLAEIAGRRDAFAAPADRAALSAAYGLPAGLDAEALLADIFHGDTLAFLQELSAALATGSATDLKAAERLRGITAPDMAALAALESVFLTGANAKEPFSAKIGAFPTKPTRAGAAAPFMARLEPLMARVEAARDQRLALACLDRDLALHGFAAEFLRRYAAEKARRGWLDFDDLILRARDLLSDPAVAEWVLYRLDGGIDHILVDEAQDTAPAQWQVIDRLAQEFTAGQGARADVPRTIFVVGDKKQSIYSFQGADPSGFDRMRARFAERLEPTGSPLASSSLDYSFRSAEPILRLVDATFEGREASGFVPGHRHRAFHSSLPGRVDLWPLVPRVADDSDDTAWYDPVDRTGRTHHSVILARRIARFIRTQVEAGTPLPDLQDGAVTGRPVRPGDVLILVRSRGRLFAEIIRAAKQEGLPIAGADRLKVMAELAVRDIVALLSFLATPEDDLSLATALRSPLFGWSEAELYALAQPRGSRTLWQALRQSDGTAPATRAMLDDLRRAVGFLRPYDLIDRILTRHDGRRRLIGRLGAEAEDGIDALLAQALAYEATDIPSLTGFLGWAQTDDLQIKRAPDAAGETLRVMTVHGAKGLEAPVVILPDCADPRPQIRDAVLADAQGALWKTTAAALPARQSAAIDARKTADAQERDRLLYVALTRAEKWLIVAAAGDLGAQGAAWYDQVRHGMQTAGAEATGYDFGDGDAGEGLRLGAADWSGLPRAAPPPAAAEPRAPMPPALAAPAPPPPARPATRAPSDLGGAKALAGAAGEDEDTALRRGTLVHAALEALAPLPPQDRAAAGRALLESLLAEPDTAAADPGSLLAEALAVLQAPDCAALFAPETLAEVPVTATLPGLGRIHGAIDRLVIGESRILAADFKTNRTVPDTAEAVPEGLLRQMGAYAAALQQVYPGRRIDTALVWTAAPRLMALPPALTAAALANAGPA